MSKKKFNFILVLFLYLGMNHLYAFSSSMTYTLTATVTLSADTEPPKIVHTPLIRISPVTKIAYIVGRVTDNKKIDSINIYYKKFSQLNWSTHTIQGSGVDQEFSYKIPTEFITENIQYRITASDGQNITQFPVNDLWNLVSLDFFICKTLDQSGGIITLPDGNPYDGETSIEIPQGALSELTEIKIEELNPNDPSIPDGNSPSLTKRPNAVYKFSPAGLEFKKPVKINLLYFETPDYSETTDISIFWFDRIRWRNIGASVNIAQNILSAKISHFSLFAVFPRSKLSANDYRPKEKIITPFGNNKKIHFDGLTDTEINIYDIRGKKIKTINTSPYEWDGTDNSNRTVESGVYIYQFRAEVDGKLKLISGTVAVAK